MQFMGKKRIFIPCKKDKQKYYCERYELCIPGLRPLVVALALPTLAEGFHLHCSSVDDSRIVRACKDFN